MNDQLCGAPNSAYLDQIRADFTNCALPSDSLSMGCITGEQNESDECGFSANLQGLCGYCASSSPNSTDSCCVTSNVTSRCTNVTLPSIFSIPPLFPSSTSSASPSATNTSSNPSGNSQPKHNGLSGGQKAGIVVGSVLGAAALVGLLLLLCLCLRRRRRGSQTSVFNQPTPQRKPEPGMVFAPRNPNQTTQAGNDVPQEGRVARMSALEPTSSDSRLHGTTVTAGPSRRAFGDNSDSGGYGDTPESRGGIAPPITGRRNGSLSSQSILGGLDDPSSPQSGSGGQYSSPEGLASAQSEQLPFFRDYYSQDEIHPGDKVATLWAYEPRAADEFELDRGEMLKVVGIWDDGWATGVRIDDRAENYDGKNKIQRDSGVSNGSGTKGDSSPLSGEIKAFPVSCLLRVVFFANVQSLSASVCLSIGRRPLRGTMTIAAPHQALAPENSCRVITSAIFTSSRLINIRNSESDLGAALIGSGFWLTPLASFTSTDLRSPLGMAITPSL